MIGRKMRRGDAAMPEMRKRYGQQGDATPDALRAWRRDISCTHPRGGDQMRRRATRAARSSCSGHSPGPYPVSPDVRRRTANRLQCDAHERKRITKNRRQRRIHLRFAKVCHHLKEGQAGSGFKENRPAFNIKEATHGQTPRKRPWAQCDFTLAGASGRIRTDQT